MDEIFIDPVDNMACHLYYVPGTHAYCVRLVDTDSDNTVALHKFTSVVKARDFVQKCLPNLVVVS